MKCKYCGANNVNEEKKCFSCNAPLSVRSNLTKKDEEGLSNYIKSVENMLKVAKKKADGQIFFVFFILAVIWMASSFFMYKFMPDELTIVIIFAVVFGLVMFIVFGASIGIFENKAMENIFNSKIKNDIRDYLNELDYTTADFQNVAGSVLDEKSVLNNFLADI